jgi:sec-independent protein translocase protein TatA
MSPTVGFLQNLGTPELLVILLVALVLFGRKLPEVARNMGRSLTQFKRGVQEASDEAAKELQLTEEQPPPAKPADAAQASAAAKPPQPSPPSPQPPSCGAGARDSSLN